MATMLYGLLWFSYDRENKRRDDGPVLAGQEDLLDDELAELGDESPHYRYIT